MNASFGWKRTLVYSLLPTVALLALFEQGELEKGMTLAPDKGTTLSPKLVGALCENGDYDGAWREVAVCRQKGIGLPDALLETLRREDAGARNE